ncbi:MAG: 3'-5' exoribonuclease YhaM family protein [Pseudothermotoga sp.]
MKLGDKIPKDLFNELGINAFSNLPFIQQLNQKLNENVEIIAKVSSKKLQEAKDQKKFLLMTLTDKTGSIRAVDWYNADKNFAKVNEGDVVLAKGRIVYFEDHAQLNLDREPDSVRCLSDSEYDFQRFVDVTNQDMDKMYEKLTIFVKEIRDDDLRRLLLNLFVEDEQFIKEFIRAPAGVNVHHAYIGGLLEHTIDVASSCKKISTVYEQSLNRDILIAGAILHDVGKVKEYRVTQKGFEVTDEGELIGHIVLGTQILREHAIKTSLSKNKLMQLEHIILSHHGELEWGSPVVPKTAEAFVIHMLENMDAKLARFRTIGEKERKNGTEKLWSEYDKHLQRRLWLGGME